MIIHAIHHRYAKALFSLALERDEVPRIAEDLASFQQALKINKKLRAVLFSPEISRQNKLDLVKALGPGRFSALFYHFLIFLVKRGRQIFLDGIEIEFQRLREKHANILRATVASAVQLTDQDQSNIISALEQVLDAKIKLETRVDRELLGGMQIRVGGKVFDSTLKTQLNRLKENLLSRKS